MAVVTSLGEAELGGCRHWERLRGRVTAVKISAWACMQMDSLQMGLHVHGPVYNWVCVRISM